MGGVLPNIALWEGCPEGQSITRCPGARFSSFGFALCQRTPATLVTGFLAFRHGRRTPLLGPPVVPFYPFLGEGSPAKTEKKGTLILTSPSLRLVTMAALAPPVVPAFSPPFL